MKQNNNSSSEKIPVLSREWRLNRSEKELLSAEDLKEYHGLVKEYSEDRFLGGFIATFFASYAFVMAPVIASSIITADNIDSLTNLKVAAIAVGTVAFMATGLTISILIGRRCGVRNMQNPKDWKNKRVSEILSGREIVEADKDNRLENKKYGFNRNFQKRHAGI